MNVVALQREIKRIRQEMENECGWMFTTTNSKGEPSGRISFVVWSDVMVCPHCGQEYVFWNQAVDHKNKCMRDTFECPHCNSMQTKKECTVATETYFDEGLQSTQTRVKSVPVIVVGKAGGEKIQREPNEYDLKVLERIENEHIDSFYPIYELPEGDELRRNVKIGISYVHQFFTKRNLIALSRLYAKIESSPLAPTLRFIFTGMINRSAKMNRVHMNNFFNGGGGWNGGYLKGTLYVPNTPTETSVLEQIGDKLSAMLRCTNYLPRDRQNAQYVGSADALTLSDDSIDYIFTDPPFGANIYYSELNSLPESWLRVITDNRSEAIENKAQGKDAQFYLKEMGRCFSEYYRILKPGRFMTVEFSNTSAAVWNAIQNAVQTAGFVIVNVAALDKQQGSFNAVTTTTAVKQDLVITCFKPSDKLVANAGKSEPKQSAQDFVEELLIHLPVHVQRNQSTTAVVERSAKILYDRLISYYVQHGYAIPMDAREFQQMLHNSFIERDGMFFTASQVVEYEEKRANTTDFVPMALFISSEADGIAWLRRKLAEKPMTYQELQPEWMQDMTAPKRGDVIPELKDILEDHFIEQEDGTWRTPDPEKAADLENRRNKNMMKEFSTYVEQSLKPQAKRMKDCRLSVLQYGFKECYKQKRFADIVAVGDHIPESLLTEDEVLLQYYDIAQSRI